jgi:putative phosphoesterase
MPSSAAGERRIGLISDTHGMLRPSVFDALAGVELILHAGDVGGDEILDELAAIAPVEAVHGNTDPPGNPRLAAAIDRRLEGLSIHMSHGHELGVPSVARLLARYDADVIIYGHTHRGLIERHGTRLVVNPGAAGPRRFELPASVGVLRLRRGAADAELVALDE